MKKKRPENQNSLGFPEPMNVFEHVGYYGRCDTFMPRNPPRPTALPPGPERVNVLIKRVEMGQDLWHEKDAVEHNDEQQELLEMLGGYVNH